MYQLQVLDGVLILVKQFNWDGFQQLIPRENFHFIIFGSRFDLIRHIYVAAVWKILKQFRFIFILIVCEWRKFHKRFAYQQWDTGVVEGERRGDANRLDKITKIKALRIDNLINMYLK